MCYDFYKKYNIKKILFHINIKIKNNMLRIPNEILNELYMKNDDILDISVINFNIVLSRK